MRKKRLQNQQLYSSAHDVQILTEAISLRKGSVWYIPTVTVYLSHIPGSFTITIITENLYLHLPEFLIDQTYVPPAKTLLQRLLSIC